MAKGKYGIDIPAGTDILIPPYLMHRNPAYWPDPEKFDPQRFSPDNKKNQHSGAYLPFAIGLHPQIVIDITDAKPGYTVLHN
jgi:cytochrome P450